MSNTIITQEDILELFKQVPLYLEELDDREEDVSEVYTRRTNPLLLDIYSQLTPKPDSIQVILNAAPLFTYPSAVDESNRSPLRGIHSAFRKSDFWRTYFSDSLAAEWNSLVVYIYNRLRYSYVNEISLVYDKLLAQLAAQEASTTLTYEDSQEGERISLERVNAVYALLGYKPVLSIVLDSWAASKKRFGLIPDEEREKALFRLQDVQNELLRRKFAGTRTAYRLLFNTTGRRGTYYPMVPLSSIMQAGAFVDDRLIRAINLPGITTVLDTAGAFDPISAYSDTLPLSILTALYYTARPGYTASDFWANKEEYLRTTSDFLAWDGLEGLAFASQSIRVAIRLDTTNAETGLLFKLDEEDPATGSTYASLDQFTPFLSLQARTEGYLDVEANELFFTENSLSRKLGQKYPFYTEITADNATPYLIDLNWLTYIEESAEQVKRINDDIKAGVQLSAFANSLAATVETTLFSVTYNSTQNISEMSTTYTPGVHKYVLLWGVVITYQQDTFEIVDVQKQLVSCVKLRTSTSSLSQDTIDTFSNQRSFTRFIQNSIGILPFRYSPTEIGNSLTSYRLQLSDADGLVDDLAAYGFGEGYFLFSHNNAAARNWKRTISNAAIWSNEPNIQADQLLWLTYAVADSIDENPGAPRWAEPLALLPYKTVEAFEQAEAVYHPDWEALVYHLNPHLALEQYSATPLRHLPTEQRWQHPVAEAAIVFPSSATGVDSDVYPALRPANTTHRYELYLNNDGTQYNGTPTGTDADTQQQRGFYLQKVRGSLGVDYAAVELYTVQGDNRTEDPVDIIEEERIRTLEYFDNSGLRCLRFAPGPAYDNTGVQDGTDVQYYLRNNSVADATTWVWNDETDGMALFLELGVASRTLTTDQGIQYLMARRARGASADVHAEFEWYIDLDTEELVYRIFPTGYTADDANVLGELVFENRGDISDIIATLPDKESEAFTPHVYSASYRVAAPALDERLIEMHISTHSTILASSFYGIVRTAEVAGVSATYNVYSLPTLDTPILSGTPVLVNSSADITLVYADYDYTDGGNREHFLGDLIKHTAAAGNAVPNISMFSHEGYNPFCGAVYDIRVYNTARTQAGILALTAGHSRQLFSYAPGTLKTANHAIRDLMLTRRGTVMNGNVKRIRVFQRDVWDSIIVDPWVVSNEESDIAAPGELFRADWDDPLDDRSVYTSSEDYLATVLEQELVLNYEVFSNTPFASDRAISFRGQTYLTQDSIFDLINTTLYPFKYTNNPFTSGLQLVKDLGDNSFKAYHTGSAVAPPTASLSDLPATPSGDTLEYVIQIKPALSVDSTIQLSSPISVGSGGAIRIAKDNYTGSDMIYTDPSENTYMLSKTYAMYPLTIPEQGILENSGTSAELGGFTLTDFKLSPTIGQFLSATNYYKELELPYADYDNTSGTSYVYRKRYTAVRAWKEGEYYFTVKYPMQVRPIQNDSQTDRSIRFIAFHFKIVVKGSPRYPGAPIVEEYNPSYDPEGRRSLPETILRSNAPEDNRTFRYRTVDIDLYSLEEQDSVSDSWRWHKVASNWDTTEDIDDLSNLAAADGFTVAGSIRGYIEETYKTPFFVLNSSNEPVTNRATYPLTVDDEDPILGSQDMLRTGRTYLLLMDLRGETTEFGYGGASYFTDTAEEIEVMSAAEKSAYLYHLSVLEPQSIYRSARYRSPEDNRNWVASSATNSAYGYTVTGAGAWETITLDGDGVWNAVDNTAFGNPYSASGTQNALINRALAGRRDELTETSYFFYTPEGDTDELNPYPYRGDLPLIERGSGFSLVYVPVDELSEIQDAYDGTALQGQRARRAGITHMAFLEPTYTNTVEQITQIQSVDDDIWYLKTQRVQQRFVQLAATTGAELPYKLAGSRNLFVDASYDDLTVFSQQLGGTYVFDATKATDVYRWTILDGSTSTSITYEFALDSFPEEYHVTAAIKVSAAATVYSVFYNQRKEVIHTTAAEDIGADTWYTYTAFTPELSPRHVAIIIEEQVAGGFTTGGDSQAFIDMFELRRLKNGTDICGFSSAYRSETLLQRAVLLPLLDTIELAGFADNQLAVPSRFMPIQFLPREGTRETGGSVQERFIEAYRIEGTKLLRHPFLRRLIYRAKEPTRIIHQKPGIRSEWERVTSADGDIFRLDNTNTSDPAIDYNTEMGALVFGSATAKGIEFIPTVLTNNYPMDLRISDTVLIPVKETFSLVSNAVNPINFESGISSEVAFTNIQLLSDDELNPAVLYELEFPPIIYDETRHHLSLNLLFRKT